MKKASIIISVILVSLNCMTLFSGDPEMKKSDKGETADIQREISAADGNNEFMISAYKHLSDTNGNDNIFFSPFSISSALAMTYAGSADKTEEQMRKALSFGPNTEKFHKDFGQVSKSIDAVSNKGEVKLNIANSLWLSENYSFLDKFLNINKNFYGTAVERLDFSKSEEARNKINKWVEDKTENKIKNLIPQGIIDALTKIVLTNAVYFKAEWKEKFKKDNTAEKEFYTSGTKKIKTMMMKHKSSYRYFENGKLQFIELPYKGNDVSMFVLLPKERSGLDGLEKDLNYPDIEKYISSLKREQVEVHLPKFKMSLSYELSKLMQSLGMKDAFSKRADFSKMTGNRELYISAIIHKSFIAVDEKGTEAAAATAVVMRMKSARPDLDFKVFKADHPFFYFIRDNNTGTVLFTGRLTDPAAK